MVCVLLSCVHVWWIFPRWCVTVAIQTRHRPHICDYTIHQLTIWPKMDPVTGVFGNTQHNLPCVQPWYPFHESSVFRWHRTAWKVSGSSTFIYNVTWRFTLALVRGLQVVDRNISSDHDSVSSCIWSCKCIATRSRWIDTSKFHIAHKQNQFYRSLCQPFISNNVVAFISLCTKRQQKCNLCSL